MKCDLSERLWSGVDWGRILLLLLLIRFGVTAEGEDLGRALPVHAPWSAQLQASPTLSADVEHLGNGQITLRFYLLGELAEGWDLLLDETGLSIERTIEADYVEVNEPSMLLVPRDAYNEDVTWFYEGNYSGRMVGSDAVIYQGETFNGLGEGFSGDEVDGPSGGIPTWRVKLTSQWEDDEGSGLDDFTIWFAEGLGIVRLDTVEPEAGPLSFSLVGLPEIPPVDTTPQPDPELSVAELVPTQVPYELFLEGHDGLSGEVEHVGDGRLFVRILFEGTVAEIWSFEVGGNEFRLTQTSEEETTEIYDGGVLMLPAEGLYDGQAWNFTAVYQATRPDGGIAHQGRWTRASATATYVESLSVPAGQFEAWRVDYLYHWTDDIFNSDGVFTETGSNEFSFWFAPGIGIVRIDATGEDPAEMSLQYAPADVPPNPPLPPLPPQPSEPNVVSDFAVTVDGTNNLVLTWNGNGLGSVVVEQSANFVDWSEVVTVPAGEPGEVVIPANSLGQAGFFRLMP